MESEVTELPQIISNSSFYKRFHSIFLINQIQNFPTLALMHPHPRQNNTFTGLSGGCEALFVAPYRFSFNGQERTDEIAGTGNHTTALYWEYDTRLGRRWNVDPKPIESLSPYAIVVNNPILMNDPHGDTTYIYNTKGIYCGVILDKLPTNEIVFMVDATARAVLKIDRSGKRTHEQVASVARNPNFAYARLTENTRKQLLNMRQKRGNPERMGLLWIDPNTKELQVWECIDCGKTSFSSDESRMFGRDGFKGKNEVNGIIFTKWHTHTGTSKSEADPTPDVVLSNERGTPWINYYLEDKIGPDGVNGLIISDKAITPYHMKEHDSSFKGKGDYKNFDSRTGGMLNLK